MMTLAFRNLFHNRVRLVASTGGVALALMLILALDAIFTGVERQITAVIDNSGADVFVAQSGVRNFHMASSSLPASSVQAVESMEGVAAVTPILYLTNMVVIGEERNLAYILGLPEEANAGVAWKVSAGKALPGLGEAVVDRRIAENSGVGLGDPVEILGRKFKIAGLSEGTANITSSTAYISLQDFAALRGQGVVSYLLVQVEPGEIAAAVAKHIQAQLDGVTALPRQTFAAQERQVVKDMSTDVIAIMNLAGLSIGMAVMALTVYTATLSRRAEYGVLKALGARDAHLYRAVLAQALISVGLGFGLGVIFTWLLAQALLAMGSSLYLLISLESLVKVAAAALVIAGLSAILPIKQISGLDPAIVFRGK
ncbi:MAG TPA: ABC transporter permease [Anaerolineales bacterium]|nr:ABC transporter permease [Anaerolineales bacterium]